MIRKISALALALTMFGGCAEDMDAESLDDQLKNADGVGPGDLSWLAITTACAVLYSGSRFNSRDNLVVTPGTYGQDVSQIFPGDGRSGGIGSARVFRGCRLELNDNGYGEWYENVDRDGAAAPATKGFESGNGLRHDLAMWVDSVSCECDPEVHDNVCGWAFEDVDLHGNALPLASGEYYPNLNDIGWSDSISSVSLTGQCEISLYEHENKGGQSVRMKRGQAPARLQNDAATSIEAVPVSEPACQQVVWKCWTGRSCDGNTVLPGGAPGWNPAHGGHNAYQRGARSCVEVDAITREVCGECRELMSGGRGLRP